MITVEDIRNSARQSGFEHVSYNRPDRPVASSHGGGQKLYQAQSAIGGTLFRGPMRSTAGMAAQDYCDYINSQPIKLPVGSTVKAVKAPALMLRQAGHKRHSTSTFVRPRKAARKPKPYMKAMAGYLYLIGEAENESVVKVGWSKRAQYARLPELQTGNSRILLGIAERPGTLEDEYKLHLAYEPDNVLQEWFEVSPELLAEFDVSETEFQLIVRNHGKVVTL